MKNGLVPHEIFRTVVFQQQSKNEQLCLHFSGKLKYGGGSSRNYFLFVNFFSFFLFYGRKPDKEEAKFRREREEISKRHEDR